MTLPQPGFYERVSGSVTEVVEVIDVATHRLPDVFEGRPMFVVFRHNRRGPLWLETPGEWEISGWRASTRTRFNDGKQLTPRAAWAITTDVKDGKPRWSTSVFVQKVIEVVEPENRRDPSFATKVKVAGGKHIVTRVPLDSKIYFYREDARAAKDAYCKTNNLRMVSAAAHYGCDSDGGYY